MSEKRSRIKKVKKLTDDEKFSMASLKQLFMDKKKILRSDLIADGWNDHGLNYKIGLLKKENFIRATDLLSSNDSDTRKKIYILE